MTLTQEEISEACLAIENRIQELENDLKNNTWFSRNYNYADRIKVLKSACDKLNTNTNGE